MQISRRTHFSFYLSIPVPCLPVDYEISRYVSRTVVSNLVCGQQTGFVRVKSRCNKYIFVVHLATREREEERGRQRGRKRRKGTRNLVFVARSLEQVLREIMQKAAFFTFYMGEHDHLQASLSRIGRASAQQRIGDEWMRDRRSQSWGSHFYGSIDLETS